MIKWCNQICACNFECEDEYNYEMRFRILMSILTMEYMETTNYQYFNLIMHLSVAHMRVDGIFRLPVSWSTPL